MQLLVEHSDFSKLNIITEGTDSKNLYIQGVFAEAELENRNGRIYPMQVMESAIQKYNDNFVKTNRAMGELEHPEGRPQVKSSMASHRTTELKMNGNQVIGKALVLNTPQGQILRGLLEGGVQMGVSSRALGTVRESSGRNFVQPDFQLYAFDSVSDPSAINAWVNAVNESTEWVVTDDGRILEKYKKAIDKQKLTESRALELWHKFLMDISA